MKHFSNVEFVIIPDGHRASDWPKDPTWTGKVKIVAKGRVAAIILLDDKNQIFAVCQVTDDSAVERTLDSGRYYVLRITNAQGRHAYIGIAFNERNDAFDFNVALAEFKSELEREDQASKLADMPTGPMKDMSLKDGEKIKIKIVRTIFHNNKLIITDLTLVGNKENETRRRRIHTHAPCSA